MKKLTLTEWEKQYITGHVERFDQKNSMGSREQWDISIKNRMKELQPLKEITNNPGFRLPEWAMRISMRSITPKLESLNVTKPNLYNENAVKSLNIKMRHLQPPEGIRLDVSHPVKLTSYIKKAATLFGADLVGICQLDSRWIFSHTYDTKKKENNHKVQEIPDTYKYVIVLGFGGGYNLRRYFPTYINTWSSNGYRQILVNAILSAFIQCLGFKVIDCSFDDVALAIPQAMQAGLGQLGRHGLLITPRFGASIRLGQIITDLPLIPDTPVDFGVTEFCNTCKNCADWCPSHSITHDKRTSDPINISNASGELKWQFNAETCHINLYGYRKPCQICISVCPFTKPNTLFHRTVRWFVDNARWADPFYLKMDKPMGYGQPKKADNFWDEWHPEKH